MNHTPTPWTQGGHDTNFAHAETFDDHAYDAMGNGVFQVVPVNGSDDAAALTATIVRACNIHHELVAAAKSFINHLDGHGSETYKKSRQCLMDIIAKAEAV